MFTGTRELGHQHIFLGGGWKGHDSTHNPFIEVLLL